jgi:DNA-binding NarL/FixJ family response regulator
MHRRLASVAVDETERARHLGWSTLGTDEEAAAFIAKVATGAAERAAYATAADLALLAAELTPVDDADGRLTRFCTAAALFNGSGDHVTAVQLLRAELADLEPGAGRARCLLALANFSTVVDLDDSLAWLHEARRQPGLDSGAALEIDVHIVLNDFIRANFAAMLEPGEALEASAETAGRADLAMMCRFTVGMAQLMLGVHDTSSAMWSRLVADSTNAPLAYRHPDLLLGSEALLRDDHEGAEHLFGGLAERARVAGDLGLHADLLFHLAHIDLRRGRLAAARAALEENLRVRADGRTDEATFSLLAQVVAWQGDLGRARALAQEAIATARRGSDRIWEIEGWFVLGLADVAEGQYEAAVGHLLHVEALLQQASCGHPNIVPWFPDGVEALLAVDRLGDAADVTDRADAVATQVDIPTARAMAARCRGLVLAHSGELARAEAVLAEAHGVYEEFGVAIEAARTLLSLGAVRRRMRQKARARADLARARDVFRACGAVIWEARAEHELERAAAAAAGAALTSSERSVAELAASGVHNREIAGRLYISEKTVEAVLTRVYRKLSVRSRTELARHPDLEHSALQQ